MQNRSKNHKQRSQPRMGRWNMVLVTLGVIVLLVLVAALFWLISSPELVQRR